MLKADNSCAGATFQDKQQVKSSDVSARTYGHVTDICSCNDIRSDFADICQQSEVWLGFTGGRELQLIFSKY